MGVEKDRIQELRNRLAYNLRIIKALWKSKWGNYGESAIGGNLYDFSSLYRSIEKGKETVRLYILCEYNYKEKSMLNWAYRIEAKTGIPHEYLVGEKKIILGEQFEEKDYPFYMSYLSKIESIYRQIEKADELTEDTKNRLSHGEIKRIIETEYSQDEQKEFNESTKDIDATIALLKMFELRLRKEADRIMSIDTADLMQQNEMLCKLVYFIRHRQKYDGISIRTIDDMKIAIKRTRTFQLKQLGKKALKEYIDMLEEHLNLARSVYTVAMDCGDFKPDKGEINKF